MKRTIRLLARLYPASWRNRYGAEFDALLDDATPSARDAWDIFWGALKMQLTTRGFGRITLACSVAGVLVASAVSFTVPVHYVSQEVYTAMPANESTRRLVNTLEQKVLSPESLTVLVQKYNLYSRERGGMPLDDAVDKMRKSIRVKFTPPPSPGNQDALNFTVEFDYPDRYVAQQVNSELTSYFMNKNLEARSEAISRTTLRVHDPPSLPLRPAAPNLTQFAIAGLFAGLLSGLTIAVVVRSRHGTTVGWLKDG